MSAVLTRAIKTKKAKIAVIGLGYVGLPLAVNFAKSDFNVFGLEKNIKRINRVNEKRNYISDVSDKDLVRIVNSGHLLATNDFNVLSSMDVIIICVPTPLKRKYTPDTSFLLSAVKSIQKYMKKNSLVILESTTYPGTTEELIKPRLAKNGWKVGRDFYLAFSPERIDPGNTKYDVTKITKIVGGTTKKCTELTRLLYKTIIKETHMVSSPKVAEMTKLMENAFRIVNIGWINEMAMMANKIGVDIWEVIEAAKTKPFGFMPFYPGLGVGGHCIPDDPLYLYWKAKHYGFNSKFLKLSSDINSNMPHYAVECLKGGLKKKILKNVKLLVIGVTYKKDVKDLRKSPPVTLIELLQKEQASVDYFDPLISYLDIGSVQLDSIDLTGKNIARYNCVLITTDHTFVNYRMILKHAKKIFDIRNVYAEKQDRKIIKF